jgi:hypothetical protein
VAGTGGALDQLVFIVWQELRRQGTRLAQALWASAEDPMTDRGDDLPPDQRRRMKEVFSKALERTVYLARDERHRPSVALKVLHPELACALGRSPIPS